MSTKDAQFGLDAIATILGNETIHHLGMVAESTDRMMIKRDALFAVDEIAKILGEEAARRLHVPMDRVKRCDCDVYVETKDPIGPVLDRIKITISYEPSADKKE